MASSVAMRLHHSMKSCFLWREVSLVIKETKKIAIAAFAYVESTFTSMKNRCKLLASRVTTSCSYIIDRLFDAIAQMLHFLVTKIRHTLQNPVVKAVLQSIKKALQETWNYLRNLPLHQKILLAVLAILTLWLGMIPFLLKIGAALVIAAAITIAIPALFFLTTVYVAFKFLSEAIFI